LAGCLALAGGDAWFFSALFVDPDLRGSGRKLLDFVWSPGIDSSSERLRALDRSGSISSMRANAAEPPGFTFDDLSLAPLRSRFRGELILPGDRGYDQQRAVWNGAIDRRPSLIARCSGARDVQEAVRFARERELLVSVRGGGHNVAGLAAWDDALMIDLSTLRTVHADRGRQAARAYAGALWGDYDHETQAYALLLLNGREQRAPGQDRGRYAAAVRARTRVRLANSCTYRRRISRLVHPAKVARGLDSGRGCSCRRC
jgi:hypothetical protein